MHFNLGQLHQGPKGFMLNKSVFFKEPFWNEESTCRVHFSSVPCSKCHGLLPYKQCCTNSTQGLTTKILLPLYKGTFEKSHSASPISASPNSV